MNGIQRQSFLPCIHLIKERFQVVDLNSGTGTSFLAVSLCVWVLAKPMRSIDYRKLPKTLSKVYYSPLDDTSKTEMSKLFQGFTQNDLSEKEDPVIHDRPLKVFGRTLLVPESTEDVARFSFAQLCGNPLSSADYIAISQQFGTIFLEDVARMGIGEKDKVSLDQ